MNKICSGREKDVDLDWEEQKELPVKIQNNMNKNIFNYG
jgi:hypothetical protein